MKKSIIILLMFCTLIGRAQESNYNDMGTWSALNLSYKVSERLSLSARTDLHTQDNAMAVNQLFERLSCQYRPLQWLRLDLVYDYAAFPSGDRMRFITGGHVSRKSAGGTSLYLRQWYMHTEYLGQDKTADTFRTKLGVSHKIPDTIITPHADFEMFYWDSFSQFRFYIGDRFKLSSRNSIDLFYVYQLYPLRSYGIHIAGLTLTVNL